MIPRSINKRQPSSIVDEWDVANNGQATLPNGESNLNLSSNYESDSETDSESHNFSQEEYDNLRESVSNLCDNNFQQAVEKTYNLKYIYNGVNELNQNIDEYFLHLNENCKTPIVNICAYHVNNKHKYPFLEYFLFKPTKENGELFKFPTFDYSSNANVITKSISIMQILCLTYYKEAEYIYKGFTGDSDNLYLFFDCSSLNLDSYKMSRNNDLWLVTIDEIINQEKVCNFGIDNKVVDFFRNNINFLYLNDTDGNIIETPTVVYSDCSRKQLEFVSIFGVSTMNEEALMGKYYYFTDYQNAIKNSGWLNESNGCGGLIRCALFLGKMKVPLNQHGDDVDESNVTKDMLLKYDENSGEYKKIKMMMRVSDRDGFWTKDYDSIYLGKIYLDDGCVFEDYPLWVVKDYNQQVVLSSHIIDKKTLDREWNRESIYFIL